MLVEIFFDKLSTRLWKENHLSDLTWALAEASPTFKHLFLSFFFPEIDPSCKVSLFRREHSAEDCRPDFYSVVNGQEYVIECKIWDRNNHFDQYKNRFKNAKFGHITNYPLNSNISGYVIKDWFQFERTLSDHIVDLPEGLEKSLIDGYLKYLRNVCSIVKLKKMDLKNLNSLYHFNMMVKKIICSLDGYETSIYNQVKSFEAWMSGYTFSLKIGNSITIYPWLGVYYDQERIQIYLEINGQDKQVYDSINVESGKDGEFYEAPEHEPSYGSYKWFYLKQELFDLFNSPACDVEEQERILRNFVLEVLNYLDIKRFPNISTTPVHYPENLLTTTTLPPES